MKGYARSDRIAELIQSILSDTIRKHIEDVRIKKITISDVKLSSDFKNAYVYYAFFVQDEKNYEKKIDSTQKALEKASGFMRKSLSQNLDLRYVPKIRFLYDKSFDCGSMIDKIIKDFK